MIETGVNINLDTSTAVSAARSFTSELDTMTKSADNLNSAFDPRVLDEYEQKLNQVVQNPERITNQQNQKQMQFSRQMQTIASSGGAAMVQASRGDVGGSMLSGGKGLAALMGGPAAMVAALGLAGGAATNAIADIYGGRASGAGDIAALSGQYGTSIDKNTAAMESAMAKTVESVSQYGKTFEEGVQAQKSFLTAGGRNLGAIRAGAYSMAYGADFNQLSAFGGMGQRYGQGGGLDAANALMNAQGLDPALFGEVVGGIEGMFSSFLSQGIIKSMTDISGSQEFFSRAGPSFQGGLGAQLLGSMNQRVSGAAQMQNEDDIFLYRAAAQQGGSMIDIKKRMEQGLTPDMFKGLMGQFDEFGFGDTESILKLSKMFGLSVTQAEQIYGLKGQEGLTDEELSRGIAAGTGANVVTGYTGSVERLKQAGAEVLGEKAYGARARIVGGAENFFGEVGDSEVARSIHTQTITAAKIQITEGISTDVFGAEVYNPARSMAGVKGGYSEFIQMIDEARTAGVSETALYTGIRGAYRSATARSGPGRSEITESELESLSQLLRELIDATNLTTDAVLAPVEVESNNSDSRSFY